MGKLKQLVRLGNQTLLEHVLYAVGNSATKEAILVLGYEADQIRSAVKPNESVRIVINDDYKDGMSTSIRAGLNAVSPDTEAALIVLADQPFLTSAVIDQLISQYEQTRAQILYPVYRGFRGNPVLIDRSLFPEMQKITGDIGCRSLFGIHSEVIQKVPVEEIGILIDIDTIQDLSNAISRENRSPEDVWMDLDLKGREVDNQPHPPACHLVIVGFGEVPQALARLAKLMNFHVTIVAPFFDSSFEAPEFADHFLNELDLSSANITPDTYIVVASQGKFDQEALEEAIHTEAGYIALMGSKKRGTEIVQHLISSDPSGSSTNRIRFPAGLQINASTPEEIAVSILAEIITLKNAR